MFFTMAKTGDSRKGNVDFLLTSWPASLLASHAVNQKFCLSSGYQCVYG
jgi:hypothetical protein